MAIKIASWNIEGRLHGYQKAGRGTAEHILREIQKLDADIIVLPEFFMNSLPNEVETQLKVLGYEILETAYKDVNRSEYDRQRWGEMHIGILTRLSVSRVQDIRPGGLRNLIICEVSDPQSGNRLRIIAIHLEDRAESMRLQQVEALVELIDKTPIPTVALGDFNATWREPWTKRMGMWLARAVSMILPHDGVRSAVWRLSEMIAGTTLAVFSEHISLRDADQRHQPTATPKMRDLPFLPSIRLVQIDHMLVSPELEVRIFTVGKDGGSDHRSISATVAFKDDN